MRVEELLDRPEKWTKLAASRDNEGNPINALNEKSCSWCLVGAIIKCYDGDEKSAIERTLKAISEFHGFFKNKPIHIFNDHPQISFKEIKEIIKKAEI